MMIILLPKKVKEVGTDMNRPRNIINDFEFHDSIIEVVKFSKEQLSLHFQRTFDVDNPDFTFLNSWLQGGDQI